MIGWISLYRKILDNPILTRGKKNSRLEAFIWLLLNVNHKPKKVLIGNTVHEVPIGSRITSLKKLEKEFGWGNTKVRNYLKLLESEGIITYEANKQFTIIHLVKFDEKQNKKHANNTPATQKQQPKNKQTNTNNNEDKINNENKLLEQFDIWWEVYDYKVGRSKAVKSWLKNVKLDMVDKIIKHSKVYAKSDEKQYIKHPTTYLNNEGWEDAIIDKPKIVKYKLIDFPHDTTGFPMAWCEGCGKKGTYYKEQIKEGSKCCNHSDLLPYDPKERR